jgi:glutamate racemase
MGRGARPPAAAAPGGRVGVIGTEATVASGAYQKALKHLAPGLTVSAKACPLFVPLVEEGWLTHPVSRAVAREYLSGLKGADALILGCTHYPVLKGVIRGVVGPKVKLVDSAEQTAIEVEDLLESLGLRRRGRAGRREFFVSDAPARFLRVARRVGVAVKSVHLRPFDA